MPKFMQAIWPSTLDPDGIRVQWRPLTSGEFSEIRSLYGDRELNYVSDIDIFMNVYERTLIAGPHPSEVSAGIAANVALNQLRNNALSGEPAAVINKLLEKRAWIHSSYLDTCKAVVAATFHISFQEIDTWDQDTLFERFCQAEIAVGNQWNPVDPREQTPTGQTASRQQQQPPQQPQQPQQRQPQNARELAYMKAKERRRQADLEESADGQKPPRDEAFSWSK